MKNFEGPPGDDDEKINEGEEEDEDFNRVEISPQVIEQVIFSDEFSRRLVQATNIVKNKKQGSGFSVVKERQGEERLYYSKLFTEETLRKLVVGSESDDIQKVLEGQWKLSRDDWQYIVSLRFRRFTDSSRVIIPSGGDIFSVLNLEDGSIDVICSPLSEGRVEALVFRPSKRTYQLLNKPVILEELHDTFDALALKRESCSQEEVLQALDHYGFRAGMVRFQDGKLDKRDRFFMLSLGDRQRK